MTIIKPDWANEGQNKALNEEYYNILNKYYKYHLDKRMTDEITDISLLKLSTEEEGYRASIAMFDGKYNKKYTEGVGLNLFKNHDNLILEIHGNETGGVVYNDYGYKASDLIQRLEDTGLIPPNTKQIYTMSCYGGLQEKGVTSCGIPFESSHTSAEPTIGIGQDQELNQISESLYKDKIEILNLEMGYAESQIEHFASIKNATTTSDRPLLEEFNRFMDENIEKHTKAYNNAKERLEEVFKKQYLDKEAISINYNKLTEGYVTDKYKQNVIDLYHKYHEHFADTTIVATEDEIKNALWYLESGNRTDLIKTLKDASETVVESYDTLIYHNNSNIRRLEKRLSLLDNQEDINSTKNSIDNLKKEITEYENKILERNEKIKDYNNILNEYSEKDKLYGKDYKVKYLSSAEAWNKYVTDPYNIPDEFYTSQGLNPIEQKRETFALNSYRKPEEPVDLSLTEEEKLQSIADARAYVEDINKDIDKRLDEKYAPKVEEIPKVETATEESSDVIVDKLKDSVAKESEDVTEKTVEKAEEKVTEEVTEKIEEKAVEETAQLTEKTVSESASNAIKGAEKGLPSWLKVGLVAGAVVGGGSLLVKSAKSKKKEKDKEDYSNYNHSSSKMTMSSGQFLQQRYEMMEDQMLAQSISRYRYGRTG